VATLPFMGIFWHLTFPTLLRGLPPFDETPPEDDPAAAIAREQDARLPEHVTVSRIASQITITNDQAFARCAST
jgi:hypothetical protein